MNEQQAAMVAEARARYGQIYPCGGRQNLEDCFSYHRHDHRHDIILWFNDNTGNTHVVRRTITDE